MPLRKISYTSSMENIWSEHIYTQARLIACEPVRDLEPPINQEIIEVLGLDRKRHEYLAAMIIAQSQVDGADFDLDDFIFDFSIVQDRVVRKNHSNPSWSNYFGKSPPSVVRKMALATEMDAVAKWPQHIAAESDAESKSLLPRLEGIVKKGREALDNRIKAETDNAIFRSRELYTFVDKVNATRVTTYAALLTRAVKLGYDKSFADTFFRHEVADSRRLAQDTAETPST